ncbi:MAG: phosphate ABC transporter substrate-binding protein [Chloroflexota bacterium]|nr:MAG: hypothetical protein DIU68_02235 [Chloroflexota bacterium]
MGRAKRTLVAFAFTLVSCSSQIVPAATPTINTALLRLYTTTAVLPLANELTSAYSKRFPMLAFDITSGNYEAMVEQVERDAEAYLMTNHLPTESPLLGFPIGQDGIAIIVHPDNDITGLTTEQIRSLYQGRVSNWRDVGGPDRDVTLISRENGSGSRAEFDRLIMGDRRTSPTALIAPSSAAMVTSVSRDPNAIGYVSMSYLGPTVRAVAVDGVAPTLENVANNSYPLRSTIFIVGQREPEGDFRSFIGWVQSPEGQTVVTRSHAALAEP